MKTPNRVSNALLPLGAAVVLAIAPLSANWPGFRGSGGAGVAAGAAPPTTWNVSSSKNLRWKAAVPGLGHSSPAIWGDRIIITTAVPLKDTTPGLKLGSSESAGIDSASDTGPHAWRIYALDRRTGKVLWERTIHEGTPRVKRHVKASHASATPATDGQRIVVMLGSEGLYCLSFADGRVLWRTDLGVLDVGLVDDPSYQWGPASSPVLFDNLVIVQNDRHRDSFVAAYDLGSGKQVWQSKRDEMPSWATPALHRAGDTVQLVTNAPKYIRAYDPRTGRELWSLSDNATQVKVPTPVSAGELVIVTGGYPPAGRPIYAIRNGKVVWQVERGSPYTSTPLVHDGIVYVLTDNGILRAFDVKTGTRIYEQRLPGGSGFSASPVVAGNSIYLASEDGAVHVVRAGRTFQLLASNDMGEPCLATPAIVEGVLFIRTRSQLVAVG